LAAIQIIKPKKSVFFADILHLYRQKRLVESLLVVLQLTIRSKKNCRQSADFGSSFFHCGSRFLFFS